MQKEKSKFFKVNFHNSKKTTIIKGSLFDGFVRDNVGFPVYLKPNKQQTKGGHFALDLNLDLENGDIFSVFFWTYISMPLIKKLV